MNRYGVEVSPSFRKRAPSAAFWEAWVAAVLTRGGLYVELGPWAIDGKDYGLSVDLTVSSPARELKVEVKSLNLEFNNPSDYPYEPLLVCSENSYKRKWSKYGLWPKSLPIDFLFVSRVTGAVIWLPEGSLVQGGHMVHDRERNESHVSITASRAQLRGVDEFIQKAHGHAEETSCS